ncbi:MAG: hypothetical protein E7063_02310 [Spirochaetaceae bacterium]|nr:hypothetical protein [Spirochaetaceae bacterium]
MEDLIEFETKLFKALEEQSSWLDSNVLSAILEEYRTIHSCITNLISVLTQKGLITPDPYRLDKKITDVQVPDEFDFPEKDRNIIIGVRLSDYERVIDFLCNFFKFSTKNLSLERIKKLVGLNNYFQWGTLVPSSSHPNTRGLAELLIQARQGADTIAVGVINGGISTISKNIVKINSRLKQVTHLQRELYKKDIRQNILNNPSYPKDKIEVSASVGLPQVKKMFSSCMGKQPFYSELVEEIFAENAGDKKNLLRQQLLDKLKIVDTSSEKKVIQINTKSLVMEAVRTLAAVAPLLSTIIEKLTENNNLIQSEKQGLGDKLMKALRKVFGIKEKPIEYVIPITDSVTQTIRNEKVSFHKTINDLSKRVNFYNSFASKQLPGFQKIESDTEPEIISFLTKQLSECQQMILMLYGYDKFFKSAASPLSRSRVKGITMELTSIKNTLVKTNQRKAEYSAYVEEQQQMKKLGITNVV